MVESKNDRIISRDILVTAIPSGDRVTLPQGTRITITHRLGGNFTVVSDFGMFRIEGRDAEVIGEAIPEFIKDQDRKLRQKEACGSVSKDVAHEPTEGEIWEALKQVFDPEIPVNIVDLGLVYSMNGEQLENGNFKVEIQMTLTAPGCGMGPAIAEDAKGKIAAIPGVDDVEVELVWDPPWNQEMITEEGKMQLGLI